MGSRTKYKEIPPRSAYGKIIHRQPIAQFQDMVRNQGMQETRMGGKKPSRPRGNNRFFGGLGMGGIGMNGLPITSGGGGTDRAGGMVGGGVSPQNLLPPSRDSFQRLKELVWNEKMKELQQQRKSEEEAARAMILRYVVGQR